MPADKHGGLDFIISLLEWDLNVDPHFVENRFMVPYSTTW